MTLKQLKHYLEVEHFNQEQLFKYCIEQYGSKSYKAAYARGFLSGLEEALSYFKDEELENEKETEI